jgi:hypothetical protein
MAAPSTRRNSARPSFRDALPPPGQRNSDSKLVPLNVRVQPETKRLIKLAAIERGEKVQDLADKAIRAYLQD